ncbi:TonB-dependent siderophore receptor [Pseudomonas viridiflava]|uniref:TonB-dependent receptor n=1 Tax=Pseudomonas viridiflava TaxID=33069 RepID=UPI001F61A3F3|nr:TonB-dependent siderophore receptor [Pseudomonas viridiflava]MCI3910405.1 TonB-dependent siderophore receptor [Pseudomonas viridiflava]
MIRSFSRSRTAAASLCLLAGSSAAYSNASEQIELAPSTIRSTANEQESNALDAVTGAGSRLQLTALQTPASTSSLDGDEVRSRGDANVQQAVARSPGITAIGTPGDGGTALSARGFTGQGSVMQLYDGSRMYSAMGTVTMPVDTWAIDRIDVLRGPASVLYGEGATGAVINVIPKKPFEGEIQNHLRLGYGSYDSRQAALDSGGSLSDQVSYRLNINQLNSNGWVDRGDSASTFFSGALRWQASDTLSYTLAHDGGRQRPMNYFGVPMINGRYHEGLRDKNYNIQNDVQRYDDQWTRLTTDWQISDQVTSSNELYYLTSHRRWQNAENYNWDAATQQLSRSGYFSIKHNQEQVGDRQTFTFKHSLAGLESQSVLGMDVNRIRFKLTNNSPYDDVNPAGDPIDIENPASGRFQSASPYSELFKSTTRQLSVFGENRTLLTDQLSIITGVRRDYVNIERNALRDDSRTEKDLIGNNWKVGLVYALTPNSSTYAQYSTSTDSVGSLVSLNPGQQQFDLATARQSEIGFKQALWDERLEWTLAAYHIVKKKLLTTDAGNPDLTQQVGQQSSNGLEASLKLQLPQDWTLTANAAFVRARYDQFDQSVAGVAVSRDGNTPVGVPKRTANLWLDKQLGSALQLGGGLRYVDSRYADIANTRELPAYTVADASLSWKALRNTTLGLQVRNLFDRQYAASQYNEGQQWILGEPRSLYVTADLSF